MVIRLPAARRAAIQRFAFPGLVLFSVGMIILGKADPAGLESFRSSVIDAAAPMLDLLSRPAGAVASALDRTRGFIAVYQENERLRQENDRLLGWQQAALRLTAENAQLRSLLKLTPEPAISYVTARIIANSGGAYARSMIVNAGRENGVARGQAAISGEGLVGRVSEVGRRAARILLITDLNSRVPVIVGSSHRQAVLAGDNSTRPSLRYMEVEAAVALGDRIVTSGRGGVFPPGLPVGVVAGFDRGVARVEPYAEMSRVDYVRIVDYGLADALPNPVPVAAGNGRRRGGPPVQR